MKNRGFPLICVLVLAFLVRLIFLDRFPIGVTHDELNYIVAAKSLFWTHSFPPGTAPAILPTPMSNFTVTIAEIPALILAPIIGLFPTSLLASRIIGAFLSVFSVLAVYFIALHIVKKPSVALVCALLMAINPWSFLMGRTIFEVNFFVTFFLWGFLVLIKSKGWKIFYALPLYLLGFFSYTGGQIGFFVFIIITLIYRYFVNGRDVNNLKKYVAFFGLVFLIISGYAFAATHNQTFRARGGELYLPSQPQISDKVDEERKLAVPGQFNNLFINKATVYLGGFVNKYLNTFSVNNLFLIGETRAAFSYQTHGTFYLIDFLFILVGLSALFTINRKGWLLFLGIIVGCAVTAGINVVENSYSQRVGLIYPFLVILSGVGIGTTVSGLKNNKIRKSIGVIIGAIYLISFINLLHIYFFRFPVYAADGWFFQDRILSKYISSVHEEFPGTKVLVYTPEPKIIFEEYLFYTKAYNGALIGPINESLGRKNYSLNNVIFTNTCTDGNPDKDAIVIFDSGFGCETLSRLTPLIRITRLKDVYENYLIYNDKICRDVALNSYVNPAAYQNFSVERQSRSEFCLNWITQIKK